MSSTQHPTRGTLNEDYRLLRPANQAGTGSPATFPSKLHITRYSLWLFN